MKVLLPKEMARIEKIAYSEGFQEELFMENAGRAVAERVHLFAEDLALEKSALLLVAKGGNSGDAFVCGRHLISMGWRVSAFEAVSDLSMAELAKQNRERFEAAGGTFLSALSLSFGVIIDGLFGTGFRGNIEEPYLSLINEVNASRVPVLSIDIPSGLSGASGEVGTVALSATKTFALGLPKLGLFIGKGWELTGELEVLSFGLVSRYTSLAESQFELIGISDVEKLLPRISREQHKYSRGFVTALAGSASMPGAAELALLGALRGGAGIAKLITPQETLSLPLASELLKVPFESADSALSELQKGGAILIGPGLSRSQSIFSLLFELLPRITKPTVIDGDALFFIAKENPTLPHESLLTPHRGEMARLLGLKETPPLSFDFLESCRRFSEEKNVTLVLKGAPTFIFHPGESTLISPFGSPGMATAGSGDILSGVLAAALARGLSLRDAALFGVSLHGIAGELAAANKSPYSMIARDILEELSEAFWMISDHL